MNYYRNIQVTLIKLQNVGKKERLKIELVSKKTYFKKQINIYIYRSNKWLCLV